MNWKKLPRTESSTLHFKVVGPLTLGIIEHDTEGYWVACYWNDDDEETICYRKTVDLTLQDAKKSVEHMARARLEGWIKEL